MKKKKEKLFPLSNRWKNKQTKWVVLPSIFFHSLIVDNISYLSLTFSRSHEWETICHENMLLLLQKLFFYSHLVYHHQSREKKNALLYLLLRRFSRTFEVCSYETNENEVKRNENVLMEMHLYLFLRNECKICIWINEKKLKIIFLFGAICKAEIIFFANNFTPDDASSNQKISIKSCSTRPKNNVYVCFKFTYVSHEIQKSIERARKKCEKMEQKSCVFCWQFDLLDDFESRNW